MESLECQPSKPSFGPGCPHCCDHSKTQFPFLQKLSYQRWRVLQITVQEDKCVAPSCLQPCSISGLLPEVARQRKQGPAREIFDQICCHSLCIITAAVINQHQLEVDLLQNGELMLQTGKEQWKAFLLIEHWNNHRNQRAICEN